MREGVWNKVSKGCWEVRGKTLGIIGYGHIGTQLSVLAEGKLFPLFCLFSIPICVTWAAS
jgi:phosphoglycerate dehydrogenase-like enzyme